MFSRLLACFYLRGVAGQLVAFVYFEARIGHSCFACFACIHLLSVAKLSAVLFSPRSSSVGDSVFCEAICSIFDFIALHLTAFTVDGKENFVNTLRNGSLAFVWRLEARIGRSGLAFALHSPTCR